MSVAVCLPVLYLPCVCLCLCALLYVHPRTHVSNYNIFSFQANVDEVKWVFFVIFTVVTSKNVDI